MAVTHSLTAPRAPRERVAVPLFGAWWAITAGWWALAFVTVSPATPDWLVRTQFVCFGNLSNGLPDAYGWARLILAPLGLLLPLSVVHGGGLLAAVTAAWRGPPARRGALVVAALLVGTVTLAEGAWVGGRILTGLGVERARSTLPAAGEPMPEHYPRLDRPAPEIALVAQGGRAFTLSDLRGRVVYLTFAFGHCNATCPLTVRAMRQAALDAPQVNARVVVVTLDPWRDRPSALASLAAQWQLERVGDVLSGTVPQVLGVMARYEMPGQRDPDTGDIGHPPLVYVIDPQGRIAYLLNNPGPDWIATAGRRAARG